MSLENFLDALSSPVKQKLGDAQLKNNLMCKHDIIAEWCAECKRLDTPSIKQVLQKENLEIVENLLSWEQKKSPTI